MAGTGSNSRAALITGASRGLGLALAQRLAEEGWNLVVDGRQAGPLLAVRDRLATLASLAAHTRVIAIPGDITDAQHRQDLANAAAELGGLDALVNNAGILGPSPLPALLDFPLDQLAEVLRVNLVAQLGVIQVLRPYLKAGARILNLTSDAAVNPYPGWGGYGASKAALEQLSAVLAAEAPDLRVYSVDPGDMRTQMHQEAYPGEDISDRPRPEESVPGLVTLLEGDLPSGRYVARELVESKT